MQTAIIEGIQNPVEEVTSKIRNLQNKPRFKSAYGYKWRYVEN